MNKSKTMVRNRKVERNKWIEKKKNKNRFFYISEILEVLIPISIVLFIIGVLIYFFTKIHVEGMESVLDFIIACISAMVLIISIIFDIMNPKQRYILMGTLITVMFTVGFAFSLIFSLVPLNSYIARIISAICVIISLILVTTKYCKSHVRYVKERKDEREREIEEIKNSSLFE